MHAVNEPVKQGGLNISRWSVVILGRRQRHILQFLRTKTVVGAT
jgi:hypothetical protein